MTVLSRFAPLHGANVAIQIPSDYGFVILVGISSAFLLTWQTMKVGMLRKKLNIHYPIMYSPDNNLFNCYQRAHQNTLESYPIFLMLLFTGGLEYPIPASLAGAVWIAGRVAFSLGYYTGDPRKRMKGAFGYFGLLGLTGLSMACGVKMLGWL